MCFFEGSANVPLMIAGTGVSASLIDTPVSNLDVLPTLCNLAGIELAGICTLDRRAIIVAADRTDRHASAPVLMEYAAEGSSAPIVAIREGRHKFVHCEIDPPQLFDLGIRSSRTDKPCRRTRPAQNSWRAS